MQVQQVMFRHWIKFHSLLNNADKALVVLSALFKPVRFAFAVYRTQIINILKCYQQTNKILIYI
jgi:hypothetical protein